MTKKIIIIFITFLLLVIIGLLLFSFLKKDVSKVYNPFVIGVIDTVNAENIIIRIDNPGLNSNDTVLKKFAIGKKSKFFKETNNVKNDDVFLQEQNELLQNIGNDVNAEAPSRFEEEAIGIESLHKGQNIKVYYSGKGEELMLEKALVMKTLSKDNSYNKLNSQKEESVDGNILGLTANEISLKKADNLDDTSNIVLSLNKDTQVIIKTKKSEEKFNEEQAIFQKEFNLEKNNKILEAPSWFDYQAVKMSDLKVGDNISVSYILSNGKKVTTKIFLIK